MKSRNQIQHIPFHHFPILNFSFGPDDLTSDITLSVSIFFPIYMATTTVQANHSLSSGPCHMLSIDPSASIWIPFAGHTLPNTFTKQTFSKDKYIHVWIFHFRLLFNMFLQHSAEIKIKVKRVNMAARPYIVWACLLLLLHYVQHPSCTPTIFLLNPVPALTRAITIISSSFFSLNVTC